MEIREPEEPAIEVVTDEPVTACVIWLHGLGADGHDFEPLVPELNLPAHPGLRFVFPHAPYRPVTLNGGYVMRAWYDIIPSERGFHQNAEHIRESVVLLRGLVERELQRGLVSERIVLAGFSQGGAIALHGGLRYERPLAGVLSLSAPVPMLDELVHEVHPSNAATPLFMAHGTRDNLISFDAARQARQRLEGRGLTLEWHAYEMDHTVVPEEIRDIARWLMQVLTPEQVRSSMTHQD